jgi:hypothetical protein
VHPLDRESRLIRQSVGEIEDEAHQKRQTRGDPFVKEGRD